MEIRGKGEVSILGRRRKCLVSLLPNEEHICVKFQTTLEDILNILSSNNDDKISNKTYEIKKLKLDIPFVKAKVFNLKGLLFSGIHPGAIQGPERVHIHDLINCNEKESNIVSLYLKPAKSTITIPIIKTDMSLNHHLIFHDNRISVHWVSWKAGHRKCNIQGDRDTLVIESRYNLLIKRKTILRAWSLMQGGPPIYRAGYYRGILEINFAKKDVYKILGPIFSDNNKLSKFFQKYIIFEEKLTNNKQKKYILAMSYLIEGLNQLVPLEIRIINLYTALEILDKSKTLNKKSIAKTFDINVKFADCLNRVRNKIVHEGLSLNNSIKTARSELRKNGVSLRFPFPTTGNSSKRLPSNFYFYLLTKLLHKVISDIGMEEETLTYEKLIK